MGATPHGFNARRREHCGQAEGPGGLLRVACGYHQTPNTPGPKTRTQAETWTAIFDKDHCGDACLMMFKSTLIVFMDFSGGQGPSSYSSDLSQVNDYFSHIEDEVQRSSFDGRSRRAVHQHWDDRGNAWQ